MPPPLDGPSIHPCPQPDFRTRPGHGSAEKREVLAKRRQRGDVLAGCRDGDCQCLFAGAVQAQAHRLYRTEPEGGGRDDVRRRRLQEVLGLPHRRLTDDDTLLVEAEKVFDSFHLALQKTTHE